MQRQIETEEALKTQEDEKRLLDEIRLQAERNKVKVHFITFRTRNRNPY